MKGARCPSAPGLPAAGPSLGKCPRIWSLLFKCRWNSLHIWVLAVSRYLLICSVRLGEFQAVAQEKSCQITSGHTAILELCLQGFNTLAGRSRKCISSESKIDKGRLGRRSNCLWQLVNQFYLLPPPPPPLLNKIFLNIYFCIYGTPTASALFVCICCCCCICIWILGVIHLVLPANILVVYLVPHKISLLCDLPGAEGIIPYLWEQDCSPAALGCCLVAAASQGAWTPVPAAGILAALSVLKALGTAAPVALWELAYWRKSPVCAALKRPCCTDNFSANMAQSCESSIEEQTLSKKIQPPFQHEYTHVSLATAWLQEAKKA